MQSHTVRRFGWIGAIAAGLVLAVTVAQLPSVQAQIPGLPKLPGGIKAPGGAPGKMGISGLDALSAAKDLYGDKEKTVYPTPNIAVSGNHVVIAWPNGVVTIETIADDGTIKRTVLGPPSEKNVS
jgi:hypothetical protein